MWQKQRKFINGKKEEPFKELKNPLMLISLISTIIFLVVIIKIFINFETYKSKEFEDVSNKEMKRFIEQQKETDQRKWENEKFFKE